MHGYVVTMYVRKTTRTYKGKTYTNHLLVESVHTPNGPRQKVVCSLGDLKPRPREAWLTLVRTVEAKLAGQEQLFDEPAPEYELKRLLPALFAQWTHQQHSSRYLVS